VLVNGNAVKSCTVLALQLEGADVLSIEGLAPADGPLHPMQEAFRENHGLQCGYCTPGMIMTAVGMVRRKGNNLNDETTREELEGNICRCTGYHNIVKACKLMAPPESEPVKAVGNIVEALYASTRRTAVRAIAISFAASQRCSYSWATGATISS
jgi:xanthine dehydrogenase iron-sulfur cluster and FAD-binding subunit A